MKATMERAVSDTSQALLKATEACLRDYGFSGFSTRKVAEAAGVPLSQIHYHFGSKKKLVLALLAQQNELLLERQTSMYAGKMPLWRRWEEACNYLDADLKSGYVRILQEMITAGFSDAEIATEVRNHILGWKKLLGQVAEETKDLFGGFGPFSPAEVGRLVGLLFLGAESMILIGSEEGGLAIRPILRKIGRLIRMAEEKPKGV